MENQYKEETKKKQRVEQFDQIRGLAIIAVVVSHQLYVLHTSEMVQCISLYSVTSLIFLMGVTKSFSVRSAFSKDRNMSFLMFNIKSMTKVLLSYTLATLVYTCNFLKRLELTTVLENLLAFTAAGPFYFVKHYIILSLWAIVLYYLLRKCFDIKNKWVKIICVILFYVIVWLVGYLSIGRFDFFSQSYLLVYSLGLGIGMIKLPEIKIRNLLVSLPVLIFGFLSLKDFYFGSVGGSSFYAEGVDKFWPKLQMNPPNVSIIIYSLGVVAVSYCYFTYLKLKGRGFFSRWILIIFRYLGRYSMDIFFWHVLIMEYLAKILNKLGWAPTLWPKRIIYYTSMFGVPIAVRLFYEKIKKDMYRCIVESSANTSS